MIGQGYSKERVLCISCFAFAFGLAGCAARSFSPYPVRPPNEYPSVGSHGGVTVAASLLSDKDESERYFGRNLLGAGVLAVLVVVQNQSDADTLLLDRHNISLGTEGATRSHERAAPETSGKKWIVGGAAALIGGAVAIPGGGLIGVPPLLWGHKKSADASRVRHQMLVEELYAETVSPGERAGTGLPTSMPLCCHVPRPISHWPSSS